MSLEEIIRHKHSGDDEQLEFIFSDAKKIIVTAPAGCGKTTAMVSKIARELSSGHIPTNKKVLAMTFSVNAAMKIKDSLKILLPELVENTEQFISKVDIANYHNFAMKLLYRHGYSINPEFVNLSEFKIVEDNSGSLDVFITSSDSDKLKVLDVAVKNSNKEEILNAIDDYWDVLNRKIIPNKIITYNGILVSAIKLLCKHQVSNFYKEYYRMIIIDEFQDTNFLGYLLIQTLIGDNTVIFLGDDVQKIYGFLGAVNGIFNMFLESYSAIEIKFYNNYRFTSNIRMKNLDKFIRDYADNYRPSELEASILLKKLESDKEEDEFIVEGIEKITSNADDKVAILVRAGWQGYSIAAMLDEKGIRYFNWLFAENDVEAIRFYSIAIEVFNNVTAGTGKAVQRDLHRCLALVESRQNEIYSSADRKFIYDAMYKLLEVLFIESKKWEGTSKDRYDNINFALGNNGLKHMMEYIDESVVLTTIHSSKGLEWEYVIIPKMNGYAFPGGFVCKPCREVYSCNNGYNYCEFLYEDLMEKAFKEEISVLYVAVTRAKKDVFMTVNTGLNQWNYVKRTSCLLNLDGLSAIDFNWNSMFV